MHGKDDIDSHWYFGGIASASAYVITHPLDLVRVQLQSELKSATTIATFKRVLQHGGVKDLYFGLGAGVQRQICYSAMHFGFYDLAHRYGLVDSFSGKVMIAGASGGFAGFINTPLETVNVRMRSDLLRPRHLRRNYPHLLGGLNHLFSNGGIRNMFNWSATATLRGMCMSVGQLSIYDQVREMLFNTKRFKDNWRSCFIASMIAGGFTAVIISPVDVIKTIGMNSDPGAFRGPLDVVEAVARLYGSRGFYRGLIISFSRLVPFTTLTFIFYEILLIQFGIYEVDEHGNIYNIRNKRK